MLTDNHHREEGKTTKALSRAEFLRRLDRIGLRASDYRRFTKISQRTMDRLGDETEVERLYEIALWYLERHTMEVLERPEMGTPERDRLSSTIERAEICRLRNVREGDVVLVKAQPSYWGTVTLASDDPEEKMISVKPHSGQRVTMRKKRVSRDKILELDRPPPAAAGC